MSKTESELQALTVFSEAFDADGWDALNLDGETLTIEHSFVPDELPGDMTGPFDKPHIDTSERVTVTAVFKVWMVMREASEDEFEAMREGFERESNAYSNTDLERFHTHGREERQRVEERDAPTPDFDEAVGGRVPSVMLYHRDPHRGPKYFGPAFESVSDFDPRRAEEIIEGGSFAELSGAEMPEVDVNHPDGGERYSLYYWPDAVNIEQ